MNKEESSIISARTWSRSLEPIAKTGYMDGAADGQSSVFQASFDQGYQQGFSFGLDIGKRDAIHSVKKRKEFEEQRRDLRSINCHVCANTATAQQNIVNLFNVQKEKNEEFLMQLE